jgi:putative transposase
MPRKTRIDAPGALHHIIARGIERKAIFQDDRDRGDFLERLGTNLEESRTRVMLGRYSPIIFYVELNIKNGSPAPTRPGCGCRFV